MRRWVWAAVLAVMAAAIIMRFLPLMQFAVWGSDSGEYYHLTERLVGNCAISTDYGGWGFGYPYFPGMFLLTGEASLLTGIGVFSSLLWVAPFAASLSVLVIMLITLKAFDDIRAGIIAGAFLAVCTPSVFSTSHPIPGGIGDLLALLCILLLLKAIEKRQAAPMLVLSSMALVMTHHLSVFFVIVPVAAALLGRELLRVRTDVGRTWMEGGYLVFLLAITMGWWYIYAVPFRDRVIPEGLGMSPWAVLALAFVSLQAIPFLVMIRRRMWPRRLYRPTFPSIRKVMASYTVCVAASALVMTAVALLSTPGTSIDVDPAAAFWFLPMMIVAGLAVAGVGRAEYSREGVFVMLWLASIGLTVLFATATSNHVLLPYRQTQYLIEPLAIFTGAGAVFVVDHLALDGRKLRSLAAAGLLTGGIFLCAATAYPPRGVLGGFEEGTTTGELDSVIWLRETAGPDELVATDHRMSSMVFGFADINATWDEAHDTLHGNYSEAVAEMAGLDAPSGHASVSMVLVDPAIESGVALKQWENARPMSDAARAKFSWGVFIKVYEADGVKEYLVDLSRAA
jgi:hypothetical protein